MYVFSFPDPSLSTDSTTALTIVETISAVCKHDRTVAMTIHQPSTRVLDTFDKVLFLSRGRMVREKIPYTVLLKGFTKC